MQAWVHSYSRRLKAKQLSSRFDTYYHDQLMTETALTEPRRHGIRRSSSAYLLITPKDQTDAAAQYDVLFPRPKAWFLIPLLATADLGLAITFSILFAAHSNLEISRIGWLIAWHYIRSLVLIVVGCGRRVRERGWVVAVCCIVCAILLNSQVYQSDPSTETGYAAPLHLLLQCPRPASPI